MNNFQHDSTKGKDRAVERLDVEDEDQRQQRMRTCLALIQKTSLDK